MQLKWRQTKTDFEILRSIEKTFQREHPLTRSPKAEVINKNQGKKKKQDEKKVGQFLLWVTKIVIAKI